MDRPALVRYDFYRGPQRLGTLWTLKRDPLEMRCALSTHRLGWELQLTAGAFSRKETCRSESDVYKTADTWRAEALAKGWS